MSGSSVHVTGRLGTPDLTRFKNLIPAARTRAIYATLRELEATVLKNPSIIARLTGKLQDSVVSFVSPGQLVFQWSALSPEGYDYAGVIDQKGGRVAPAGFAKRVLAIAKEILIKHLVIELQRLQP